MEQNDIIIAEVNVTNMYNELVENRNKIREGAAKIISDNIDLAKDLTKTLIASKDVEEIKNLSIQAQDALKIVKMVSYASGVEYYLPYSTNYDDSSDIMSYILQDGYYDEDEGEEHEYNELLKGLPEVRSLTSLFRNLEQQSGQWNTSFC